MKIILFDFFGVFSTPVYKTVIEKFLPQDRWEEYMSKLDLLDTGELSEDDLVSQIAELGNQDRDIIIQEVDDAPIVNEDLFSFAKDLQEHYRIGLLTNIPRSLIERIIPERLGFFDIVLVSSDLGLIKPDPEIFKIAIGACQCDPKDILFIDDSPKNIEVAKSLDMNGIVYETFDTFKGDIKKYT